AAARDFPPPRAHRPLAGGPVVRAQFRDPRDVRDSRDDRDRLPSLLSLTSLLSLSLSLETLMKNIAIPLCLGLLALPAIAQEQAPQSVDDKIQELDQKIRVLDRKIEIDKEAADEKAKAAGQATAGKDGFSLRSADGNYVLRLRGYVQFDGR